MPASAPRNTNRWTGIGVLVAVAAIVASIVVIVIVLTGRKTHTAGTEGRPVETATPEATQPQTPVSDIVGISDLPGLLLDPATVSTLMGSTNMTVNDEVAADSMWTDTTDRPDCGGVWANTNQSVYKGSGWMAVQNQSLKQKDVTTPTPVAYQSVVSFPSAESAAKFVAKEAQDWPKCSDQSLTNTTSKDQTKQTSWAVDEFANRDGMLTARSMQEGAGGWGCRHALTARNNVVVDVETCSYNPGDQAVAIAKKIADRIP